MADSQGINYLRTFGGWAIVLVVGVAWYYRSTLRKQKAAAGKGQGKLNTDFATDTLSAAKKKAEKVIKQKSKPKPAPAPSTQNEGAVSSSIDYSRDDDTAANSKLDREFARQLSNAKTGTQLSAKKSDDKRQKSVKQSRALEKDNTPAAVEAKVSAPSSTTGDADDDLSPAVSPAVQAADSRDVSDMLEKQSTGPSILRLTGTDSAQPKPKKAKAPEVVESKKQRQNKKKAEAAKLDREEEEKERKMKMEAQRRQARIAEGRAAKDGSSSAPPKDNAWTAKAATNGDSAPAPMQPLDTFERKVQQQSTPAVANLSAPKPAPATKERSDSWMSSLPSEEEQLQLIQEDDAWNQVTSKKKKGKKAEDSSTNLVSAESRPATSAPPAAEPKSKAPVNGVNKNLKPALTSNSSFAALTPEETADDDDDEVEWEV